MRVKFGEWTPDTPDLDSQLADVVNALPYAQHYTQLRGTSATGNAIPALPQAVISSSLIGGVSETFAAAGAKLYRLNTSTLAWDDVTGAAAATESPMVWGLVQSGKYILAASFTNLLRSRLVGGGANFASITNGPRARCLGTVRDFVFACDINDPTDGVVPNRVRWSAIGDPLTWPLAGTAGAQTVQSDQQDMKAEYGQVRAIFGSDLGLIFQERAITRASYVGTPLIFKFDLIDAGRGIAARNAGAQIGRAVFFLAPDGFFATDGSGESKPIGDGRVDQWFFANANPNQLINVQAFILPQSKCVCWSFASTGSSTNDSLLIYNFNNNRWSRALANITLALVARTAGYTLEQLDAFGTLETIASSFDAAIWQGGMSYPAVVDANYKLADFTGSPLDATFETGSFCVEGKRAYVSGVRPMVEGGTCLVSLGTQANLMGDPVWTAERSVTAATGKADFRSSAFYQRVRVRVTGGFGKAFGVDALMPADDGAR